MGKFKEKAKRLLFRNTTSSSAAPSSDRVKPSGQDDNVQRSSGKVASDGPQPNAAVVPSVPDHGITLAIATPGPSKPAVPTLSSNDLWRKAMDKVKDTTTWRNYCKIVERDFNRRANNPEDIIAIATSVRDSAEQNSRTKVVRKTWDNIITALNTIKDVGGAVTALNPYASVAWGGLQFFVQAAVNNRKVRELCWGELPRMTFLIARYQTFEEVYTQEDLQKSKQPFEDALIELYTSLLLYQVTVVNYAGSRMEKFKAMFQDMSESQVQQILDDIKQHEDNVVRIQATVDREIETSYHKRVLNGMTDLTASLAELEALTRRTAINIESISQFVEATQRSQILEWVSPIKYENTHNKTEKAAISGTGTWLLENGKYVEWLDSRAPSTLWLHGFMGSGKSCLAHLAIEDIRRATNFAGGERFAFFYCDGTDREGASQIANVANILRSFVKQLSSSGSGERLMNTVVDAYKDNQHKGYLTKQQSLDLICDLVRDSVATTFVIDGLDECPLDVQRQLTSSLGEILTRPKNIVKLFVSSRANPEIQDLLSEFDAVEIEIGTQNQDDIDFFVQTRITEAASSPGLRRLYHKGQKDQKQAVIDKLQNHAGGMFRWVQISINYLHGSANFGEMARRLSQLEHLEDLFDLYEAEYRGIMERRDERDRIAIKTALIFLLHGESFPPPLKRAVAHVFDDVHDIDVTDKITNSETEIEGSSPARSSSWSTEESSFDNTLYIRYVFEACSFRAGDGLNDEYFTADDIIAMCPSLIVFEVFEDSGEEVPPVISALTFPHFSVREFLLKRHAEDYSYINGNTFLAQLSMEVFVALDARAPSRSQLLMYAALNWINHLLRLVYSPAGSVLDKVVKENETFRTTLNAFLLDNFCTKAFVSWNSYMQAMLSYIENVPPKMWKTFAACYLVTSPPSSILVRLLLDYGWDSMSPPEAALDVSGTYSGMKTFHLAAMTGNSRAINLLMEQGFDINGRDNRRRNALFFAAGANEITDSLCKALTRQAPSQTVGIDRISMIRILIQHGIDVNAKSDFGGAPVLWMIWYGDAENSVMAKVKLLVEHGADPPRVPIYRPINTYLADGAIIYDLSVMPSEWAFWTGMDVNASDALGRTPFHRAAQYCSEETIRSWFERGADPYIKDFWNEAPIDYVRRRWDETEPLVRYLEDEVPILTNVNLRGWLGRSPFHNVVSHSSMETIMHWIEHGANPFLKDDNGETPITIAMHCGRDSVVRYLKSVPPYVCDSCKSNIPFEEHLQDCYLKAVRPYFCDSCKRKVPFEESLYHCDVCKDGHYDLCSECWEGENWCLDSGHKLRRIEGATETVTKSTETPKSPSRPSVVSRSTSTASSHESGAPADLVT